VLSDRGRVFVSDLAAPPHLSMAAPPHLPHLSHLSLGLAQEAAAQGGQEGGAAEEGAAEEEGRRAGGEWKAWVRTLRRRAALLGRWRVAKVRTHY
jgi:hypothetical protein